jgi:hypothetical protein
MISRCDILCLCLSKLCLSCFYEILFQLLLLLLLLFVATVMMMFCRICFKFSDNEVMSCSSSISSSST